MRLSNTINSIVALSLLALIGCKQVEIPDAEKPNGWGSAEKVKQEIKVENVQELGLPENVIKDGLALSVFSSMSPADNNQFTYSNSAFSGEAAEGGFLVAMYPYSADATMSVEANKMYINTVIPSTQNFVVDSEENVTGLSAVSREGNETEVNEDNNETPNDVLNDLSFAVNSGSGFKFKSVYSKVTLPIKATYDISIDSISVVGGNGEKLSGDTKVEVGENISPVSHMADTASVNIGYKGDLELVANNAMNVIFNLLPQNFTKGLTVSLFTEGKEIEKKTYNSLNVNTESFTLEEFEISRPQYFIEYKAGQAIELPGYICEYSNGNGKIYFSSSNVPDYLLQSNTSITELTIPSNITVIGQYAFDGCSNLKKVEFNEGLQEINYKAFLGCGIQGELKIPSSVHTVLGYVFENNNNITSVTFGNVVTTGNTSEDYYQTVISDSKLSKLGYGVFYNCGNISGDIVLPSTITQITESFKDMGNSEGKIDFYLLGSVPPTVNQNTFKIKYSGYNIFVPSGAVETYKNANVWKDNYANYINAIGEKPEEPEVNEYYIEYTTSDKQKAVLHTTDVLNHTFDSNSGKGKITFNTSKVSDFLFFKDKDGLAKNLNIISIVISSNITEVGNSAFRYCDIKSVAVPKSVRTIWGYAFADNVNLESITFGEVEYANEQPVSSDSKLTTIKDCFMQNCSSNLKDIVLPSSVSSLSQNSFNNINSNINLYLFCPSSVIQNVKFSNSTNVTKYEWKNNSWQMINN